MAGSNLGSRENPGWHRFRLYWDEKHEGGADEPMKTAHYSAYPPSHRRSGTVKFHPEYVTHRVSGFSSTGKGIGRSCAAVSLSRG